MRRVPGVPSLRARLTAIILTPLMVLSVLVGLWQLGDARRTAADVFDRSLLAAALAVANDVAISGGDALSPTTRDVLADTSGGRVFYHVYAPDGVIVAGYATPPVGIPKQADKAAGPTYFEAIYLGRDVHGVRLQNTTQIDGYAGVFTTTVWQDAAVRAAFVRDLLVQSVMAITGLLVALALIVWFGVRIGLNPLLDLQAAIASRNSDELSPIRRPVPHEVAGIVGTLNALFDQVSRSMTAQSEFISNAAHQLRNPIAGVLAMAEAVEGAPDLAQSRQRSKDLLEAARETANLSQKLLLLERAKAISPLSAMETFDMGAALDGWGAEFCDLLPEHVSLSVGADCALGEVVGDQVMLREALRNLLDNALRHGGPDLTGIGLSAERSGRTIRLSVSDDGVGLAPEDLPAVLERFRTVSETSSSGLGVSIVEAVARGHRGTLTLVPQQQGLSVVLELPIGTVQACAAKVA